MHLDYISAKPGISNLITIYSTFTNTPIEKVEQEFAGSSYADFKTKVGEAVVEYLRPIQQRHHELVADKAYLESVMKSGAEKASRIAGKTLAKVYRKVGFVGRP